MSSTVLMIGGLTILAYAMWPLPVWRYWLGLGGTILIMFAMITAMLTPR